MPLQIKTTGIKEQPITTIERFASRFTIMDNGCWQWTGYIGVGGYGQFTIDGRSAYTHRVMYELVGNPIDLTLQLDHLCRNRACINPKHLEQVTARVNALRGLAPSATHALKTHCVNGHPLSGDNVYFRKTRFERRCKACNRMTVNAFNARRKEALNKQGEQ